MKRFVKKIFLAPDSPSEGGALIAFIHPKQYSGSDGYLNWVDSDFKVRDCSQEVGLEFTIYNEKKDKAGIKKTRAIIKRRRAKVDRLVKFVNDFADKYHVVLDELESELDEVESELHA